VIRQLFSGLVELSPELDIVPDVARSWEVSEGGRRYLFHLRDDVRWSDGRRVTAGDFEYAWKRVLDPTSGSRNAGQLYDVKGARAFHRGEAGRGQVGVRALDEATLAVDLEGPTGYFLHLLTAHSTYPLPRHVVEAQGEAWTEVGKIVSNGPFRLEGWRRGKSLLLARNQKYHGRFRGNVQQVEVSTQVDRSATLESYEADGLDVLDLLVPTMDRAPQRHPEEYVTAPRLFTSYVGFNVSRPPFDDRRVRRALALATDRERLADVVLPGHVSPATGGFIPPGMPGHSPGISLPYDPEAARHLLAEAGYPDGRGFPALDCLTRISPVYDLVCKYLEGQWLENLGIGIAWQQVEWGRFQDRMSHDRITEERPHMGMEGWEADYPDPDNFLRKSDMRHYIRQWNEAYDRLVEEAGRLTDQGKRMKLYGQADGILVEEAAVIPLGYIRWNFLVKPWVSKLPITATGVWLWKDVIIEPH
jgi:oligopeptide transport system substrate-binding protein